MQFVRPHRIGRRDAVVGMPRRRHGSTWLAAAVVAGGLLAGCGTGNADADAAEPAKADQPALASDADKASYSLGYRFAENVQRQFPDNIDHEAFVRGVADELAGQDSAVDPADAERVLTAMVKAQQAKTASESLHNLNAGLAFLEKNGKRDGVTTTESGLQYEVLRKGKGEKPKPTDTVTTNYEGRLIDGTVFDSSYKRGEPATFPLNRVIPGWTEGLQLMSPGAKYRLYVPADLAYGARGAGPVPPNSALIFDVELLSIGSGSDDSAESGSASDSKE